MTTPRNSLDIAKPPAATRVVAAMSGGVDSSVVAALLKREGYDVIGVTLQLYDHGAAVHRAGACCAGQDIHDARRVAEAIGIPHYVLDYESRFRDAVIERFAESYLAGETPIPCVECNRTVKFRDLLGLAKRTRRRCAGDRPLCRQPRARQRPSRPVPRRRCEPRPELFPLCDDAGAARPAALPARRHRQGADPRARRRTRPRHRRQARQPGHLLRPQRPLCRRDRAAEARRRPARRHRPSRRPRARPP